MNNYTEQSDKRINKYLPKVRELYATLSTDINLISGKKDNETIKKIIASHLKQHNIRLLIFYFTGSGDSGDIDNIEITFEPEAGHDPESSSEAIEAISLYSYEAHRVPIYDLLANWVHEYFFIFQTDWYNNDGGYGEVKFDVSNSKFTHEVHYNELISRLGEQYEEDL